MIEFAEYGLYDEAGNVISFTVVPWHERSLLPHQDALRRLCNHLASAGGGPHRLWWGTHPTRMAVELEVLWRTTPLRSMSLPLELNTTDFNVVTIRNGVARDGAGRELHTRDGIVWTTWPKLEFPIHLKEAVLRAGYKRIDQERLLAWCSMAYPLDNIPRTWLANRVIGGRGTSTHRLHSA